MRSRTRLAAALTAAIPAAASLAGPLSPPAGPVSPTHKTLSQVEPRTPISPATTPGDGDASFVISQPGSYYLTGNMTGEAGKHGIQITVSGVTIDLMGFEFTGGTGSLDGINALVPGRLTVRNGTLRAWDDDGLHLSGGTASPVIVEQVRAIDNAGLGLRLAANAAVTACSADNNAAGGISTAANAVVERCSARFNTGTGISVSFGSVVQDCIAWSNTLDGIAANNSTVRGCLVRQNANDGISAATYCRVLDNTCIENGYGGADGAGIHATGGGNRIEGNHAVANDRGIDVDTSGNLVVRNSLDANATDLAVAAGNSVGPTVTAATIATNNSPHANYAQ